MTLIIRIKYYQVTPLNFAFRV